MHFSGFQPHSLWSSVTAAPGNYMPCGQGVSQARSAATSGQETGPTAEYQQQPAIPSQPILTGGASGHLDDALGVTAHFPGIEGADAHRHLH